MKQVEKPLVRVIVWDIDRYPAVAAQKDFRTLKAAENFAYKWGHKEDGNYDPEICWNNAAQALLEQGKL